ncbi:uncharacterized protein E0L32_005756 [Thyridium curvatum]|uniref:3',5'-cyclic-nucleotide phosphodiesterase n=1 Tax=Thyridium curvatum TaxID=1093900 RepID=A0A507AV20_9PEZI|nr:uncharacterized protein E0L32_005756 [Thyridium curvatum]TPX13812.1 hypothetical protein E0L32_005756 [Thyridium curvatum]
MGTTDEEGGQPAPAMQVIVLGSGGGPLETNITSFLVRSLATGWAKGSIVSVDSGVLMGSIASILEKTQPEGLGKSDALPLPYTLTEGPFAGLELPHASPTANAAHIVSFHVDTFMITHPHLDHICGFVVNTAGFLGSKQKRLACSTSTADAFKYHIFNDVIWPNLTSFNGGAGLVVYHELNEGGSPAFGEGDSKGYLEISDGISVKMWGVSHGHCISKRTQRSSNSSSAYSSVDAGSVPPNSSLISPRATMAQNTAIAPGLASLAQPPQRESSAPLPGSSAPSGTSFPSRTNTSTTSAPNENVVIYNSSAYFIRDVTTGREVLIFGDVEPDSMSHWPRNIQVWQDAAPKIVAGHLKAVFIESSYDNSQTNDRLFGHMTPRFLMEELSVLADEVRAARAAAAHEAREARDARKRKRSVGDDLGMAASHGGGGGRRKPSAVQRIGSFGLEDPVSPRSTRRASRAGTDSPHLTTPTAELSLRDLPHHHQHSALPPGAAPERSDSFPPPPAAPAGPPLQGLKVVVIHIKDKAQDGETVGETILQELLEHEEVAQLGCEFVIPHQGMSLYF